MKSPFNLLNEQPSSDASPSMQVAHSQGSAGAGCDYEMLSGASVFDGAGSFDGGDQVLAGDPPDVGSKTRQLLWAKGVNVARAPAATLDRFCCLTGPCCWYSEIHVDEPDTLPERTVRVIRLCRFHRDDDGGTLELSEGTIPACVTYSPPWWSIDGWRMKLIVVRRLDFALNKISKVVQSPVWAKLVKWCVLPEKDEGYGTK